MKKIFSIFLIISVFLNACTKDEIAPKNNDIALLKNEQGIKLMVDGKAFMINGMNWDYFPIGTNFSYSLWQQPESFIKQALDSEMKLLKAMGVNTIRVYTGIQPKWVTYIYKKYGIYTMLNHPFGRYGVSVNGNWIPATDFRNVEIQKSLITEVSQLAETYKNTPGLLLFLLGNENNYGLFWAGAETEDFPDDENEIAEKGEKLGRPMYKLMNDAAKKIKEIDTNRLVAICNGDLGFIDIISEECKDVDIFGTNMYRGKSFTDAFKRVKEKLNKPILFTEFGADAYDAIKDEENQKMQAFYMVQNWKEIYTNVSGLGKSGIAIGGFTFQFSDGWWKFGQTINLDKHDTNASWATKAYDFDYKEGANNMNEEWFGICAKGATDNEGFYKLKPRIAYYALKQVHQFNPYKKEIDLESVNQYFSDISLDKAVLKTKN